MEHQAYVQADGDVVGVSAEREIEFAAARQRSQKSALVTRAAVPHGCGDAARRRSPVEWTAGGGENRRPQCKALPTGEHLGAGELSDQRYPPLCSGTWQRSLPAQPVHIREAHGVAPSMDTFDAPMRDVV